MAVKNTTAKAEPTPKDEAAFWKEKVTIRLPLNPGNPEDQTVFVSVNDYSAQLMRGVDVQVPRNVAAVLMQSENASLEAFMNRQRMSMDYEQEAARHR